MRLLLALLLALPLSAPADDAALLKDIQQRWAKASQAHDVETIAGYLAEDFIHTDEAGMVRNRRQYLEKQRASRARMQSVTLSDLRASVFGDAAVVTGAFEARGSRDGQPFTAHARFTETWLRRSGKWKCVAGQNTAIQ